VTGGSRGLGLLLAREYQRRGARVAICARDAAELERAKSLLDGCGRPVVAVPCDVSREDDAVQLVAAARQHLGPLDTVVNNAGIVQVGPYEHMTRADYEEAMRVHFFGALQVTAAALREMRRRRCGRIVNIASIAGLVPVPHLLPYSASKSALAGWSQGLRAEVAKDGIAVTTVCPALLRTGSARHGRFKGRHRSEYAWFSVGDSLPGLSLAAGRAAARVVRAAEAGRALLVMPAHARVAIALHGLWPDLVSGALAASARLLPPPGGIGSRARLGSESASGWSPSALTALNERAARRLNQLPGDDREPPAAGSPAQRA
jgi:short-subunit dehydrogenase